MLDMLVSGCTDVQAMTDKALRQMRKKIPQIEEALYSSYIFPCGIWCKTK